MWKLIAAFFIVSFPTFSFSQQKKVFDFNYKATIKNTYSISLTTALKETDGWDVNGYSGEIGYFINPGPSRLAVTYGVKGMSPNKTRDGTNFSLLYQYNQTNLNINLSLSMFDGKLTPETWYGKLDVNVKW